MSFRKRNVDLSHATAPASARQLPSGVARGTRPSAVDGRLTISTGTPSLDGLLAGHGGLPLGNSLLIEENGNTDYSRTLQKYYTAEGVVQGQVVHLLGLGERWARSLPGLVDAAKDQNQVAKDNGLDKAGERMKIAWRYERQGEFGTAASGAGVRLLLTVNAATKSDSAALADPDIFCHTFDLAKKLAVPAIADIMHHTLPHGHAQGPFTDTLRSLTQSLTTSSAEGSIHRVVVPTLLSPAMYPPHACEPQHVLQFLHQLRSLLRQFPQRLTVLISLPLELHPRSSGLVRWIELLCDGVLELTPFPHASNESRVLSTSGAATAQEEKPQGMVEIHKLPVFHERCGGGGGLKGLGDELAFTVSRRRFVIKPFSLPPAEGDTEAQAEGPSATLSKDKIEF